MMLHVLKIPRLTEKSVLQKEIGNQVTFVVEPHANKIEIKKAVEEMFKVTVLQVHTISMRGKKKRLGRFTGRRPNWKKAMVTLQKGDSIEYFEGA